MPAEQLLSVVLHSGSAVREIVYADWQDNQAVLEDLLHTSAARGGANADETTRGEQSDGAVWTKDAPIH
jgi:hypothetical protein